MTCIHVNLGGMALFHARCSLRDRAIVPVPYCYLRVLL